MTPMQEQRVSKIADEIFIRMVSQALVTPGFDVRVGDFKKRAEDAARAYVTSNSASLKSLAGG